MTKHRSSPVNSRWSRILRTRSPGALGLRFVPFYAVSFPEPSRPRERNLMSRIRHILILTVLLVAPASVFVQNLDSLLARMTLDEKLGQLNLLSAGGRGFAEQIV